VWDRTSADKTRSVYECWQTGSLDACCLVATIHQSYLQFENLFNPKIPYWNHDLSFDIWHKQRMCSLYFRKQVTKLILIRFLKKLNLQSRIYAQMVEIIMN
jgi:hypothetical protein